jgi:hypothetical protein
VVDRDDLREPVAGYARGLIAAGDRAAIETFVAPTKTEPLDDVCVEIDAFLERRAFAPR